MNRLEHVRETLPYSLERLGDSAEIVLLDYHSTDGLHEYIASHHREAIEEGKLIYLRTTEPSFFHHSHARNVLARVAEGPLLCVLDADNFLMDGFSDFILERFAHFGVHHFGHSKTDTSNHGRIAVLKEHWLSVGGFDEQMVGWGWEDNDFVKRLMQHGLSRFDIPLTLVSHVISHGDEERIRCLPPELKNHLLTNDRNRDRHYASRAKKAVTANQGKSWGVARVTDISGNEVSEGSN